MGKVALGEFRCARQARSGVADGQRRPGLIDQVIKPPAKRLDLRGLVGREAGGCVERVPRFAGGVQEEHRSLPPRLDIVVEFQNPEHSDRDVENQSPRCGNSRGGASSRLDPIDALGLQAIKRRSGKSENGDSAGKDRVCRAGAFPSWHFRSLDHAFLRAPFE